MSAQFIEFEVVMLLNPIKDVAAGEVGVVLMVHGDGEAYEVEFPNVETSELTYTIPSSYLARSHPTA